MKNTLLIIAVIAIAAMNLAAFLLMGEDKRRAKKGAWRIPEKTLFLVTGLFGGLGGTVGMFMLHHKTRHWYFRIGFPVMLIAQIALLAAIGTAVL